MNEKWESLVTLVDGRGRGWWGGGVVHNDH